MSKLSKLEILEETIKFYSENPSLRSIGDTHFNCMYNGGSGKHCAVGRCLMTKYKKEGGKFEGNSTTVSTLHVVHNVSSIDKLLSSKYRGHGISFWEKLQLFHDGRDNWDDNGITEKGKVFAEDLRLDIYGNII